MNLDLWQEHALSNRLQTLLLLGAMAGFLALLGWLLWGATGVFVLLILGVLLLFSYPMVNPRMIMGMYRATHLPQAQAPVMHAVLSELTKRAGLATAPELYYVPSSVPNAFALGARGDAAIAVTDGLLHDLERREVIGVLAHEISHIRSNDTQVMNIADLFSRLTSMLSLFGQLLLLLNLPLFLVAEVSINWWAILVLILAPNLSSLAQLGLSRTREYDADLNAARLTGDPKGLASALVKIGQHNGSLFERILLPGRRVPDPSLLRTHPPTKERVQRLLQLEGYGAGRLAGYRGEPFISEPGFGARIQQIPRWHISGLWH